MYDTAFDPSLLAYFRRRLARSARPNRIFEAVREVVAATGVLKARQRRALDSTVLDDAVATQDTVTQLIAAVRRVIRDVPGGAAAAAAVCRAHDYADPGKPRIAWNDEAARADLVDALVTDAVRLLAELPEQELGKQAANAVGLLALVAGQDVEPAEDSDGRDGRWRIARHTVPDRMISTVDPESRHVHKTRTHRQEGFKAHIAIEPETGLITAAQLTPGAGPEHHEATVALDLLDDEPAGLQIFGDTAYSSDATCGALTGAGHELFLKPAPLKTAVVGGYSLDDFAIDTTAGTVTCPPGIRSFWARRPGSTCSAEPPSPSSACPAHCVSAARRRRPAGSSPSAPTTTSRPPPDIAPRPTRTGKPPTGAGGPRSSASSHGSPQARRLINVCASLPQHGRRFCSPPARWSLPWLSACL